jgi:hypothetical protein
VFIDLDSGRRQGDAVGNGVVLKVQLTVRRGQDAGHLPGCARMIANGVLFINSPVDKWFYISTHGIYCTTTIGKGDADGVTIQEFQI